MEKDSKTVEKYIPANIEQKWQEKWASARIYSSRIGDQNATSENAKKYYVLAEFAYPSGDLHMGHWFTWVGADVFARFKRMQGYNVFFPNGFDAFGLPAENAAIKRGIHPRDWTLANIAKMKEQYMGMGPSFTFDDGVITCDPYYYRWNQWIFLQMYRKGLAYLGKKLSNWCPNDQTVLANEGIEDGKCWRCGAVVEQKEISQWFLRITEYAERLLWPEKPEVEWPKAIREAQNQWVGKSEGVYLEFPLENDKEKIKVFTTALDTVFGVSFMVVAPEHSFVKRLVTKGHENEVNKYIKNVQNKSEIERVSLEKDKTGVFTGSYVINPLNGEKVPVWIADYVIASYGTGAVMGVPGHDGRDHEFAKKFELPINPVIRPKAGGEAHVAEDGFWNYEEIKTKFLEKSELFDSGQFNGLTSKEGKQALEKYIEEKGFGQRIKQFHLHDWSVSRQRYWGTPVPMIHCPKCGIVPVPEKDLPVELPYDVDYAPKGEPPLATNKDWLKVRCPKCGGQAKRDAETMDTFVDSSWYFFRYLDPKNEQEPFDKAKAAKTMPVDIYFGGAEHTLGHTLYSRFFTKFFKDIGLTDLDEYALRRINHGIILGPDNAKMSKSKGNVVNPDEEVKRYGADAIRVYLSFFIPYEGTGPWVSEKVYGAYRFLQRVWGLKEKVEKVDQVDASQVEKGAPFSTSSTISTSSTLSPEDLRMMHATIKKVSEDIELIHFNTAIAALMEWLNYLSKKEQVSGEEYQTFLLLLAPFAPHMTEELWQRLKVDQVEEVDASQVEKGTSSSTSSTISTSSTFHSVHLHPWPVFDASSLLTDEVTIVVQINGKLRDTLIIHNSEFIIQNLVEKQARESEKIKKYLEDKVVKNVVYREGKIINFVTD